MSAVAEQLEPQDVSRVVHLIDSGGFFGAEQVIVTLATEQQRRGMDVIIATIVAPGDGGNPLGEVARQRGIAIEAFEMADGFNRAGLRRILDWIDFSDRQVVHCHGYKANILLGIGAPKKRDWRLVTTLHGWTATHTLSKLRLYEVVERCVLHRFDSVCIVSDTMRARLPRRMRGSANCITVWNGIEPDTEIVPLPGDVRAFAGDRPIAVAVGRLSAEKDVATLIRAMALLVGDQEPCCLVVVGDGPERRALQKLVDQLDLGSVVMLAGYRDSPRRWMSHCDLFVLSSRTEGLPMVVLEAMEAGLPVVATSVGAIPEVLEGTDGVLVPAGDADALRTAILVKLRADDSDADRVARRDRLRARFSSRVMADRYSQAYGLRVSREAAA